jgi:hypothetical protein
MDASADTPPHDDASSALVALQQEVAALIARWRQAGIPQYEVAVTLATAGYRLLGHAVGHVAPPEGPELIQEVAQQLQRAAESCYFQHWREDAFDQER